MEKNFDIMPLVRVIDRLRAPDGCPWDSMQTHESLRRHMIEEAYEVCDAIDREDADNLCEELGDVLYQVVFHASLAAEDGRFDLEDVIGGITEKMKRRHPKLYPTPGASDVPSDWESIKRAEKAARHQSQSLPAALPVTMKLEKLLAKLEKCGVPEAEIRACAGDERQQATLELAAAYRASGEEWELSAQSLADALAQLLEKHQK